MKPNSIFESEELFSQVFDSMFMFVGCFTTDGTLHNVNRATIEVTGVKREDLVGRRIPDLIGWQDLPESKQRILDVFGRALRGRRTRLDIEVQTVSNGRLIVDVLYSPVIDSCGVVIHVFASGVDVTERRHDEQEIVAARDQLRDLGEQLRVAREEEARRISRELHDELGSSLTALKWRIERLESDLTDRGPLPRGDLILHLRELTRLAQGNIQSVKRIASQLRPGIVDGTGLVSAVTSQAQEFETRYGIACRVTGSLDTVTLSEEQGTAIFRIVQEALTNVLRHADATNVEIFIQRDGDELLVDILDDGRGIGAVDETKALGVVGMRERAHIAGGTLEIRGDSGRGTTVALRIALH